MKIKKKISKGLLNKLIIGLGYGIVRTKEVILNQELGINPQDAMDALSVWMGRELMKELLSKKVVKVTDDDEIILDALTSVVDVAEEFDVDYDHLNNKVKIVVQDCLICPKRVGGYNLEGYTSCPVGGIITGALSYARGSSPIISKNNLQTGEICHIEITKDSSAI